jgi:hypothetical protein
MVEKADGIRHLKEVDWTMDRNGHWPRVEIEISSLKEAAACPCCKERLLLNEMECLFGVTRMERNDILVLVSCLLCHLPVRIGLKHFTVTFPDICKRMEGWAGWEKRRKEFEKEEKKYYGTAEEES